MLVCIRKSDTRVVETRSCGHAVDMINAAVTGFGGTKSDYEVLDMTAEEVAALPRPDDVVGAEVRAERNRLLAECDWTQLIDVPLDAIAKGVWSEYRQALRDITKQENFPENVIWPTKPQ